LHCCKSDCYTGDRRIARETGALARSPPPICS
jgi:hypothetical protein